jgi:hypothetical protein
MALAPRPRSTGETGRTSVKSASGKAAQRARNKDSKDKGTNNSGSSGAAKKLAQYPSVNWEDVEADLVHVTDISGKVTQSQMGAGGYYTMLVAIPMAYIHNAVDAALASNEGMLYIRMYKAPLSIYLTNDDDADIGDTSEMGG